VDGWRRGWIAAEISADPLERRVRFLPVPTVGEIIRNWPDAPVGIDMPIGLPSGHGDQVRKGADVGARAFLGRARSSIFFTPPRAVLELWSPEAEHAEVSAWAKQNFGSGISIQAWNIFAKMAEVDAAVLALPGHARDRVWEVHPECSFRTMAPDVEFTGKLSSTGAQQRLDALRGHFDVELATAPRGVPVNDLLDALAVAWSIRRWQHGRAELMPAEPEFDERGLRMQLVR
jgi:predicted RNase H-like nuclease